MGMTNDEINAMISNGTTSAITENGKGTRAAKKPKEVATPVIEEDDPVDSSLLITQAEIDSVLTSFVSDDDDTSNKQSLLEEIHSAILDSGRLTLVQWMNLRKKLREIETLIPHIDLIIRLKSKREKTALEQD